ncbi:hypothetical protein J2S94_003356 [Arthrobacter bambusae]|nr:hypothetical protein [Arthrobacter bambusae]
MDDLQLLYRLIVVIAFFTSHSPNCTEGHRQI